MTLLLWIDESLPRAIAVALREGGFEARDVRDLGMRGRTDREILAEATAAGAVVISGDLDFANPLRFPPESHGGVVVLRFRRGPARGEGARALVGFLKQAGESSVRQAITILEPGRARRFGRPQSGRPTT
ncbi:MAG: DUF5615 family PIN-like protein [Planctomycetes bacterium]|nr:DUF5615 family PIN-like protein [Planctomycetota bacterium]